MTFWQAVLLGLLQGLTEFLPVSSSGHLVIGQYFLGFQKPELLFDVGVHFATLGAVAIYFRKEIWKIFAGIFSKKDAPAKRTAFIIIIGTIPAVIVGFTFADFFESLFNSPKTAAAMLVVTGLILLTTIKSGSGQKAMWKLKWFDALIVGTAQAAAILPGISRSGITIAAGLHLGIKRDDAARFSFLLSLPAILGAAVLEAKEILVIPSGELPALGAGMITAGLVGYCAISVMMKLVSRGKLYYFAPYCILLGLAVALTV